MRRVLPVGLPVILGIAMVLAGCATTGRPVAANEDAVPARANGAASVTPVAEWRASATPDDNSAIDSIHQRWSAALAAADGRFGARLRAEGALLQPGAAQPLPSMPPGPYACRLIRLGGRIGFATYKPDNCYVDGDARHQSFTKQNGSSLPGGWLYPDAREDRLVFLGTNRLHREDIAPGYGALPGREVAGVVERVAPFRWRMVLSRPFSRDAAIELYELIPITPPPVSSTAAPMTLRRQHTPLG